LVCPLAQIKVKQKTNNKSLISNGLNKITTVMHYKEALLRNIVAFGERLL
jgi:hypothetical protein